ncbi:MAG: Mannose-1-phosphate guanylyltransferase/mannose-6-phosphate isomerase [Candidatus Shapirobacteria bacterium GW2011_GWE2_38_30]|uniref:Mannose-1-phosphate guanylyltransferase/mannose-6-phosphate isomerase n=2 Tax=Candidatus Shapironibacteriota TaxID=1752721 RepID=A0A0G0K3Z7_9BACT|nr:MAG: Mannose-1-phosphate guanylyltransferase/mannose-6-phosphate isomerase [Candidatus Shapirobacteria bacterium GW2011_GWE2_38_30]
MKPVIICGGYGTKMWPVSRRSKPKHFLPLINGKSLFELNYEAMAKELVPELDERNFFLEPEMRNHGPATGFTAMEMIKRGMGDEPFMLIQTDLIRTDNELFLKAMDLADEIARREKVYITGGMKPEFIVEGVDYLVKGELIKEVSGVKLYRVADYIDRTEKEKIKSMMGSDNLLLHWNHTAMTGNNLMEDGGDVVENYSQMSKGPLEEVTVKAERAGEAVVVEFPFEIWDFGTWESVKKYLVSNNLYQVGQNEINIDSNDNYVRVPREKQVVLIGVEGLVVIDSGDALLVAKGDETGKVGQVVERLKGEGKEELF